ncbi:unnamed protein product [Merluccius merluccius]
MDQQMEKRPLLVTKEEMCLRAPKTVSRPQVEQLTLRRHLLALHKSPSPKFSLALWGLSESCYPYKGYVAMNVQFVDDDPTLPQRRCWPLSAQILVVQISRQYFLGPTQGSFAMGLGLQLIQGVKGRPKHGEFVHRPQAYKTFPKAMGRTR